MPKQPEAHSSLTTSLTTFYGDTHNSWTTYCGFQVPWKNFQAYYNPTIPSNWSCI